jgi:hypothetical protein
MLESAARFIDGLPVAALTVTSFLAMGPLVLVHELGHGLPALPLTDGPVLVKVGRPQPLLRFRLGRVLLELHPLISFQLPFAGICAHAPARSRSAAVAIALGGPAASLLTAAAAFAMALSASAGSTARAVLVLLAGVAAWQGAASLVPRTKTKGGITIRTDGGVVLDLLRRRAPVFSLPEPPGGWLPRRGSGADAGPPPTSGDTVAR